MGKCFNARSSSREVQRGSGLNIWEWKAFSVRVAFDLLTIHENSFKNITEKIEKNYYILIVGFYFFNLF